MDIRGKRVLITGGAVRVGSALCRAFALAGAQVVIHFNRSSCEAAKLLTELGGSDAGHLLVEADFSQPAVCSDIFERIGKSVDILINNASVFDMAYLASESVEQVEEEFNINFFAPLELMKQFKVQLKSRGVVINFLDQRVAKIDSEGGSYPLSQKALADATMSAALQWAPKIRVNAIAPGPVLPPVGMENSSMEKTLRSVPLGASVDMDDLVNSALFLVANDSITGQVLYVDGGQHLL